MPGTSPGMTVLLTRGVAILLIFLFLGRISLAAVAEMKVDCENEYLVTENGGYTRITTEDGEFITTGRQRYFLVIDSLRIPLSPWAQPIMGKLDLALAECR
jgi:hypothetical protein